MRSNPNPNHWAEALTLQVHNEDAQDLPFLLLRAVFSDNFVVSGPEK